MSLDVFSSYLSAIKIIKSREILEGITISSYPHLGKEAQLAKHRAIYKEANPELFSDKKPVLLSDIARILKNG